MAEWSGGGWRRVWMICSGLTFGTAVVVPVLIWAFRDLSTAATVTGVVSLPLTGISGLLGLVAAWSDRYRPGEDSTGPGERSALPFGDRVRRWVVLWPIWQRLRSKNSRRQVMRITAIVAATGLLTAGLVGWDRAVDYQPQTNLLSRVPETLRESCSQVEVPGGLAASAFLSCQDASGQEVAIGLFDTDSSMADAYGEIVRQTTIPRGSGDCAIVTGAEHRYPAIGVSIGRTLCYKQNGNAFLVWTDDVARTVASARRADGNDFELHRFWTSLVSDPSYPTAEEGQLFGIAEETSCHRAPAGDLDRFPGVVAAIECEAGDPGADTVSFYRFADQEAMRRSYNSQARDVQAKAGACADGEAPGFLAKDNWNIREIRIGQLLCYPAQQGELVMEWTVEPMRLLVRAVGTDPQALYEWWKEDAGPSSEAIFAALNEQIGFPNSAERVLLDNVPPASRVGCTRPSLEQRSDDLISTPVAAIFCDTDDGPPEVFYYQFSDAATMVANYDSETSPGTDCFSMPPDFTGEDAYSNGTATGRLACATGESSGLPYLIHYSPGFTISLSLGYCECS